MYISTRLLLAVFAACLPAATATGNFTYTIRSNLSLDMAGKIIEVMNDAIDAYHANGGNIPDEDFSIYYNSTFRLMHASRATRSITFPGDSGFLNKGYAIAFMSKVFGVGTMDTWTSHCVNGVLTGFPETYKLFHSFPTVKYDQKINCTHTRSDQDAFYPFGLISSTEFDDDTENRHMALVQAMVTKDHLQEGRIIR